MSNSRALLLAWLAASLVACGGGSGDGGQHDKPPIARIGVTPKSGAAPLSIAASSTGSTDPDGTIVQYDWDFGDGSTANGPSAQHVYATVGEFVVKLTVTDDQGLTGAATTSVTATGALAVYNGSLFDAATYQDEPSSGTLDSTPLQ